MSPAFTIYEDGNSFDWVSLNFENKEIIVFGWVTSHIGIRGNEKADSASKSFLELPRVVSRLVYLIPILNM